MNVFLFFAFLTVAALFAGGTIYDGLTGVPPFYVAFAGAVSVVSFGLSMLFGMLYIHDKK